MQKPRIDKPLSIAALFGGAVTAALYLGYFIKLMLLPEGALAVSITVAVLVLAVVPLVFHGFFMRHLGRAYKVLKAIYAALTCFYAVSFAVMCVYIFTFPTASPTQAMGGDTVAVVFGCKAYDYGPGKTLRARLDTAVTALDASPSSLCVVSGGQGYDEPVTEASAMQTYLLEKGITADRIISEDKSRNTRQNLDNTLRLLDEKGVEYSRVACISSRFHLARISLMCQNLGIEAVYYPAADDNSALIPMLVREYMSFAHYFIFGY